MIDSSFRLLSKNRELTEVSFKVRHVLIYSGSKNSPSTLYSSFLSFFFALWKPTSELLLVTSCSTLCCCIYAISFSFVFLSIFIFLKNERIFHNEKLSVQTEKHSSFSTITLISKTINIYLDNLSFWHTYTTDWELNLLVFRVPTILYYSIPVLVGVLVLEDFSVDVFWLFVPVHLTNSRWNLNSIKRMATGEFEFFSISSNV